MIHHKLFIFVLLAACITLVHGVEHWKANNKCAHDLYMELWKSKLRTKEVNAAACFQGVYTFWTATDDKSEFKLVGPQRTCTDGEGRKTDK